MVDEQLVARGIKNERVLNAMRTVPREEFMAPEQGIDAYRDSPLPIGSGQTISQPYMVAWMTELLDPQSNERVLEIGLGSGYQAAVLAMLANEVFSIERVSVLAESSQRLLQRLGYGNIFITTGDGTQGWQEHAPYDGIIVTAGAPGVPRPLLEQLADNGGRMVIPIGDMYYQTLTLIKKDKGRIDSKNLGGCMFVPLIGRYGWSPRD